MTKKRERRRHLNAPRTPVRLIYRARETVRRMAKPLRDTLPVSFQGRLFVYKRFGECGSTCCYIPRLSLPVGLVARQAVTLHIFLIRLLLLLLLDNSSFFVVV